MERHFTRAQVEERTLAIYKPIDGRETVHVQQVGLLDDMPIPVYLVKFIRTREDMGSRFRDTVIYTEMQIGDGMLVLWPHTSTPLPEGCATIEEEDKAIEKEKRQHGSL